jgi:hypothetical protein
VQWFTRSALAADLLRHAYSSRRPGRGQNQCSSIPAAELNRRQGEIDAYAHARAAARDRPRCRGIGTDRRRHLYGQRHQRRRLELCGHGGDHPERSGLLDQLANRATPSAPPTSSATRPASPSTSFSRTGRSKANGRRSAPPASVRRRFRPANDRTPCASNGRMPCNACLPPRRRRRSARGSASRNSRWAFVPAAGDCAARRACAAAIAAAPSLSPKIPDCATNPPRCGGPRSDGRPIATWNKPRRHRWGKDGQHGVP